jgi:hypothetical protein
MYDKESLTIESADGLERKTWEYFIYKSVFYLDRYVHETRPSKRHKFIVMASYSRIHGRDATIKNEANVPVPDFVQPKIMAQYTGKLSFKPWEKN